MDLRSLLMIPKGLKHEINHQQDHKIPTFKQNPLQYDAIPGPSNNKVYETPMRLCDDNK